MTVKVLLVDDQELIRSGLRMMVEADPAIQVVADVANGAEAISAVDRHRVDVVLMDVQMPVLDGLEATTRLLARQSEPPLRVVMLATFDDDEYVYRALRAGASGYLLKSIRAEELTAAVHGRGRQRASRAVGHAPPDHAIRRSTCCGAAELRPLQRRVAGVDATRARGAARARPRPLQR